VARVMLGEPLHPATLLGGAAILVGVYLVTRAGVRERAGSAAAAATLAPSRQ